jgi:histidine triad (HIT) family protein
MSDCLFCKIRDGQIPAKVVYRDDLCLGFSDIDPQAPTHVLFIPLEHVASLNEMTEADRLKLGHLSWAAARYAKEHGLAEGGYRTVVNTGRSANQSVFHIHLHLLAGRAFTWPPG